jgi:diguanylate cyclase (GGDEF)-like protein
MEPVIDGPLMRWIARRSATSIVCIVIAAMAAVAIADWHSTADIAFTLAYMLPLALAAWRLPRTAVVACAIACACSSLAMQELRRGNAQPNAIIVANFVMELLVFLAFGLLLSALRDRLARESTLARTDSLTGMPNRRAFLAELEREADRCARFGQPFSVAYLDIDRFKQVNDRLGHAAGDALLQRVGYSLQTAVRKVDLVARLGGDEFAMLLPGADSIGSDVVMRRIAASLAPWIQREFGASCSIGCLTVLRDPPPPQEIVARVDALMYRQKAGAGGGTLHETMAPQASRA